jgi:hypothetical protein
MPLLLRSLSAPLHAGRVFETADIDSQLAGVLIVCIVFFTIFPLRPILGPRPIPWSSLGPALCLTLSSLFQIAFIGLVATNVIRLEYSLKFAAFGIPIGAFSIVLAWHRKQKGTQPPRGTVVCSILGLIMWTFLITAH